MSRPGVPVTSCGVSPTSAAGDGGCVLSEAALAGVACAPTAWEPGAPSSAAGPGVQSHRGHSPQRRLPRVPRRDHCLHRRLLGCSHCSSTATDTAVSPLLPPRTAFAPPGAGATTLGTCATAPAACGRLSSLGPDRAGGPSVRPGHACFSVTCKRVVSRETRSSSGHPRSVVGDPVRAGHPSPCVISRVPVTPSPRRACSHPTLRGPCLQTGRLAVASPARRSVRPPIRYSHNEFQRDRWDLQQTLPIRADGRVHHAHPGEARPLLLELHRGLLPFESHQRSSLLQQREGPPGELVDAGNGSGRRKGRDQLAVEPLPVRGARCSCPDRGCRWSPRARWCDAAWARRARCAGRDARWPAQGQAVPPLSPRRSRLHRAERPRAPRHS